MAVMEIFGAHSVYILASYASALVILGGMILSAWLGYRKAKHRLAVLENQKAQRQT